MKNLNMALLASSLLMATSAQAYWEGNWLLGISGGGAWQNRDENVNIVVSSQAPFSSQLFVVKTDNDDHHGIWGFLGGFQARWCNILVGLEFNVDWRFRDEDSVNYVIPPNPIVGQVVGTISHDRDTIVGLTGRLGYNLMSCLMPYIRLGVDYREREVEFSGITTQLVVNVPFDVSSDENDETWGFVVGLGLEYFIPRFPCLSIRGEWDYHSHVHSDNVSAAINAPNPVSIGLSGGGQHNEQTARVSLVYNFPI